jgi:hypothetical protein
VELLVVIAIISILAGMLLPALEEALESARRATCMSNLRQLHLSLVGYERDSDTYLPFPARSDNCPSGNPACNVGKLGYPSGNPKYPKTGLRVLLDGAYASEELLKCPSMDKPWLGWPYGTLGSYGYRYNSPVVIGRSYDAPYGRGIMEDGDRVWRVLLSDAGDYRRNGGSPLQIWDATESYAHLRFAHETGGHYARHDGAVGWVGEHVKTSFNAKWPASWPTADNCQWYGRDGRFGLDYYLER